MTIRIFALIAGISLLLTIILWPGLSISKEKSEEAGPAERAPRTELRVDRSPQSSPISTAEFPEGLRRDFEAQASGFVAASSGLQTGLNLRALRLGRAADRPKLRTIYECAGFRQHSDFNIEGLYLFRYQYEL